MILGPRIEVCKPGRACRHITCRRPVGYRVRVVTKRHDRQKSYYQDIYYCPLHALRWARNHDMQLPKVR